LSAPKLSGDLMSCTEICIFFSTTILGGINLEEQNIF
jgi:hypothetical protein